MSADEIINLLREALTFADSDLNGRIPTVELDATLSQLGIDSINALEMAAYIEDKLGVQFPDNELGLMADIRGFVSLIQKYAGNVVPEVQS